MLTFSCVLAFRIKAPHLMTSLLCTSTGADTRGASVADISSAYIHEYTERMNQRLRIIMTQVRERVRDVNHSPCLQVPSQF